MGVPRSGFAICVVAWMITCGLARRATARGVTIRQATLADLPGLVELEEAAWPKELRASPAQIEQRLRIFPEGFFVAVQQGKIVGATSLARVDFDPARDGDKGWVDLTFEGDIGKMHREGGNALDGISTTVHPDVQGQKIGERLIDASLALAEKLGVEYRITCCRLPGYDKSGSADAERYVRKQGGDEPIDPLVRFFKRRGFEVVSVVPGSMPKDAASGGYGVLMVKRIGVGRRRMK